MKILGCDIGNVIVAHDNDKDAFNNNHLDKPPIDGAFESLKKCVETFNRVYVVSKCGIKRQDGTLAWLEHHDFYNTTGIKREDVLFCRKRADKAVICNDLKITHFIDDRLEILLYILDGSPNTKSLYLFNPSLYEMTKWQQPGLKLPPFYTWQAVLQQILLDV